MDYTVRKYLPGEENYVARAHERVYSEEYQWGPAFTVYAMKIALDFAKKEASPREGLWVAETDGTLIGSVLLCETEDVSVGQLRLFLVEKAFRNCGVGSALSDMLLQKAKELGYRRLVLWTASPLADAIRHYEKLGFHETARVPNYDWSLTGNVLDEIKMECDL